MGGSVETTETWGAFWNRVMSLPFYRALAFTLTYTFVVTPFVLVLGLAIAVGVNNLPKMFKGVTIFMSLLPMMVPPVVGALILLWMVDAEGIIGATIQNIFNDPNLSIRASGR
jgi:ABC-type sugar transport system permease subunit